MQAFANASLTSEERLTLGAFHKTFNMSAVSEVRLKFPKFTMNLAISFRSCQSNSELGNEVGNFTLNFVTKLRSWFTS